MKLTCYFAVILLLVASAKHGQAQDPLLKGLIGVRVAVTWTGGAVADRDAIQTDVELRLRQAGMHVATSPVGKPPDSSYPLLFVLIGGTGTAAPVGVELHESVYLGRDYLPLMKFTAFNAYAQWYAARVKEPRPITDSETKGHLDPVMAEMRENSHLSFPPSRDGTTWQRHGVAQSTQSESVKDIIARYASNPYWQTPAGRPIVQHQMDLEVQAAMAEAQRPANSATVRDTVRGFVDAFLNDWLGSLR